MHDQPCSHRGSSPYNKHASNRSKMMKTHPNSSLLWEVIRRRDFSEINEVGEQHWQSGTIDKMWNCLMWKVSNVEETRREEVLASVDYMGSSDHIPMFAPMITWCYHTMCPYAPHRWFLLPVCVFCFLPAGFDQWRPIVHDTGCNQKKQHATCQSIS